jgi:hypothetical protein
MAVMPARGSSPDLSVHEPAAELVRDVDAADIVEGLFRRDEAALQRAGCVEVASR